MPAKAKRMTSVVCTGSIVIVLVLVVVLENAAVTTYFEDECDDEDEDDQFFAINAAYAPSVPLSGGNSRCSRRREKPGRSLTHDAISASFSSGSRLHVLYTSEPPFLNKVAA